MRDYSNLYDVIIIGGGPAGLTAALYAARARERVLVIENGEFGGQIALTAKVMNYPGVRPCSGRELAEYMEEQARDFGAKLIYAQVRHMELEGKIKKIVTDKHEYQALSVILAAGALPRSAGFEGEQEFKGRGVAYCATCDGPLFAGCELFVIGGGLSAVEEAIFLTSYSDKITLVVRDKDYSCAKTVSDKLKLYPGIRTLFHTEIIKVSGQGMIEQITLKDKNNGKVWTVKAEEPPYGVFVFAGYEPNTAWLPHRLQRNPEGYLITDEECRTNIEGVSAAGDIRRKSLRQVVTAASDGATAAVALEERIRSLHQEMNLPALVKGDAGIMSELVKKGILRLWLDDSKLAEEMVTFFEEEAELSERVNIEIHREEKQDMLLPSIEICHADGRSSGIHFHAVPKGLEWNSFQMALFNVLGPGQKLDTQTLTRIRSIDHPIALKVIATLTCGNCPATVMAACQIAALNDKVSVDIFDIVHFRKLRFKYHVMSVPLLIIDEDRQIVGKMSVEEMLDALGV